MVKNKQVTTDESYPSTQTLSASTTIAVRAGLADDVIYVSSSENVTLNSSPRIQTSGVSDRQTITIVNVGTFSITIPNGGSLATDFSIVLRAGKTARFIYSASLNQWVSISGGSMALQNADSVSLTGGKIAGGLVYSGSGVNFNNRSLFQILSDFETANNITSNTFGALNTQALLKTNTWTIKARLTSFPNVSQMQALVQPYVATTELVFLQSFYVVARLEECVVLVETGTPSDGLYYLFQNSNNSQFSIKRVPDSAITLNAGDLIYARDSNQTYQVVSIGYGVDPLDPFGNEYFYPILQAPADLGSINTELSNQADAIAELQSRSIKVAYVSSAFDLPETDEMKTLMAVSDGTDPDEWLLIRASVPLSAPGGGVNWTPNGIFYKNASNNLVKVSAYESIGSIPEGTMIFSKFSFRYYATIILTDSPTRYFFEQVTPIVQIGGSDEILVNNNGGDVTVQLESNFLERIDTIEQSVGEKVSFAAVGQPLGLAPLDEDSKVPSEYLPPIAPLRETYLYTTPGTYSLSIPSWATRISYRVLGAGGGGGGGRADVAGVNRTGGSGGAGGGYSPGEIAISDLIAAFGAQTALTVVVGTGGNGGNSVAATSSGGNGVAGEASSLQYGAGNYFAQAPGGARGSGGTTATVPGGTGGTGLFLGGTGGQSATSGASVGASSNNPAAAGGGGGASMNTSNAIATGAVGGIGDRRNGGTSATGGAGAATGNATAGSNATALTVGAFSGGGGGGGGSAASGNGGKGGDGIRGGGGGGGGSATGGVSGAGGRGGDGAVEVTFY